MKKELFQSILSQILNKYGISKEEMYEQTKMPDIVNARYLLFYVCVMKGISISRLQILLKADGFDMTYATILRGIKVMEKRILEDADYSKIISSINTNQN
jgi:chromosomal replication initiation ATPase DnaA